MKYFKPLILGAAIVLSAGIAEAANSPPAMVVPGQLSVQQTGAASYSIPIEVPPGTAGMLPALSLEYSSQGGNGIVGLGWALGGLPSISRCPRTIAQDGTHGSVNYGGTSGTDMNDKFCMGGQRLILVSGTYGADGSQYRTEIESFSKITENGAMNSSGVWFEVRTKSGQILQFGNSSDSRVMTIGLSTNVARAWEVNKISDTAGNYLTITYNSPSYPDRVTNGESYPIEIDYTGNLAAGVSPYNSVKFTYQCQDGSGTCRQDAVPIYQAGAKTQTTVLLTDIKTYQSTNLVHDYQLSYNTGSNLVATTLASVTLYDGSGNHLNTTTFGWQGGASYLTMSSTSRSVSQGNKIIPGDFDGDGNADVLIFPPSGLCPSSYSIYNGPGFTTASSSPFPNVESSADLCQSYGAQSIIAPNGASNVILPIIGHYTNFPPFYNTYLYTLNTGIGNYGSSYSYGNSSNPPVTYAGDFDGDGLVDIFIQGTPSGIVPKTSTGGWGTSYTAGSYSTSTTSVTIADFDGDGCSDVMAVGGVNTVAYSCSPAASSSPPPTTSGYSTVLGDFNGDGKTDALLVSPSGAAQLLLSTGTGFTNVNSTLPSDWGKYTVYAGDFNGDGKADILLVAACNSGGYCAGTSHKIYLSTGTGFTQALDSVGSPVTISNSNSCALTCVTASVADWNNDATADIWLQQPTAGGGDATYTFSYTPQLMTSVSNGIGASIAITYAPINQNGTLYQKCSGSGYNCGDTYPTQSIDGPFYVVSRVDSSNGLGSCPSNCYSSTYSYQMAKTDLSGRGFLGFGQKIVTDLQTNIVETTSYSQTFPYVGMVTSQTKKHSGTTLSSVVNTPAQTTDSCALSPAVSSVYVVYVSRSVTSGSDLNGTAFPTTTTDYTIDACGNQLTANSSVSDGSSKLTTNTYNTINPTSWFLGQLATISVQSKLNSTCSPSSACQTRQSSFGYDSATGLLNQEVLEPGVSTCSSGLSSSCTLTTNYTLDAFGHRVVAKITGAVIPEHDSSAVYDSLGQFQIKAINALGQAENWAYDARFGTPTSHTGPNLLTTNWTYDTFGRLTQESRPDGTQTKTSYSYCGGACPTYGAFFAQSEIFASNGTTQIGAISTATYDSLSRGIASDTQGFNGATARVETQYDANERVAKTSRPYFIASNTPRYTSYAYDDLGRVTQATMPDGSVTGYCFNALKTAVTNNLNQTTTINKNAQGLNASIVQGTGLNTTTSPCDPSSIITTTSYVYDAFGDLVTVTDPSSNVTTNVFDIRGNKVSSADPDMGTWTYAYDELGELTSQTDAASQTTSLTYDLVGHVLTRSEVGSTNPNLYSFWTYGTSPGAHNVGKVIDAKACTTSSCTTVTSDRAFTFDSLGRPDSIVLATGGQQYGYHEAYNTTNGQLSHISYPSGFSANYTYNAYGYLTYMADDQGTPIWTGNARDAEMHLTSQTQGNGVLTTQSFDPMTGLIQAQKAGLSGAVANFAYSFDTIGNLTARTDSNESLSESFCYDSLNRLIRFGSSVSCSGGGSGGKTATYDAVGNIVTKSDIGTYTYPSSGSARPHAVSSITGTVDGLTNPKFSYDANGNMTCMYTGASCTGTVRQVTVTSFNMAATLVEPAAATTTTTLTYDDQHARVTQAVTASSATTTTTYLNDPASGAMSQKVQVGTAIPKWVDYLQVDGQIVAQRTVTYQSGSLWGFNNWGAFNWGPPTSGSKWGSFNWGSGTWNGPTVTWAYFSLDHLNSVAVITDQGGNVLQRLSYDPWGKQRNGDGTDATCGSLTNRTTRGFTNQEQMPAECLVNLNARIYDPSIGRFMAADTIVPDPYDGQSFNRFSYVSNNPLSFTDPSGHDGPIGFAHFCCGGITARIGEDATSGFATYLVGSAGDKTVYRNVTSLVGGLRHEPGLPEGMSISDFGPAVGDLLGALGFDEPEAAILFGGVPLVFNSQGNQLSLVFRPPSGEVVQVDGAKPHAYTGSSAINFTLGTNRGGSGATGGLLKAAAVFRTGRIVVVNNPALEAQNIDVVTLGSDDFYSIAAKHGPTNTRPYSNSVFSPNFLADQDTFLNNIVIPALDLDTATIKTTGFFQKQIDATLPYVVGTGRTGAPTNTVTLVLQYNFVLSAGGSQVYTITGGYPR